MNYIVITPQIIRDHLVFNGPSTLSELCRAVMTKSGLRLETETVLDMLKSLEDRGSVRFDTDQGIYTAQVTL